MLKTILLSSILLSLSTLAFADKYAADTDQGIYAPGPYVGLQLGYGMADAGNNNVEDFLKKQGDFSQTNHWLGSTFIVGWSFWRYFAIEGSYTDYPDKDYDLTRSRKDTKTDYEYIYETKSWDVSGKLSLPLSIITSWLRRWDIYGKGGFAYISGTMTEKIDDEYQEHTIGDTFRPVYELGIDFNFNKYFLATASWVRINGKHSIDYGVNSKGIPYVDAENVIPTADLFAIGVSFKFANLL